MFVSDQVMCYRLHPGPMSLGSFSSVSRGGLRPSSLPTYCPAIVLCQPLGACATLLLTATQWHISQLLAAYPVSAFKISTLTTSIVSWTLFPTTMCAAVYPHGMHTLMLGAPAACVSLYWCALVYAQQGWGTLNRTCQWVSEDLVWPALSQTFTRLSLEGIW
jgi:hypothetical protein